MSHSLDAMLKSDALDMYRDARRRALALLAHAKRAVEANNAACIRADVCHLGYSTDRAFEVYERARLRLARGRRDYASGAMLAAVSTPARYNYLRSL